MFLPENSQSLGPGLSKWGLELSELKTQAKEAVGEEIRCRNIKHLFSQKVVKRTAEAAIVSMGFGPCFLVHFITLPF